MSRHFRTYDLCTIDINASMELITCQSDRYRQVGLTSILQLRKAVDGPLPAPAEAIMSRIDLTKTAIIYSLGLATIAVVALNGALKFAAL